MEDVTAISFAVRRHASPHGSSGDTGPALLLPRAPFTRSRSPVVTKSTLSKRHVSPAVSRSSRRLPLRRPFAFFPTALRFHIPLVPTKWTLVFSADFKKCGESHILLGAILYGTIIISGLPASSPYSEANKWIIRGKLFAFCRYYSLSFNLELLILSVTVVFYSIWTHSALLNLRISSSSSSSPSSSSQPSPSQSTQYSVTLSPRSNDHRESKRGNALPQPEKNDFGFIWMTVPKNYRWETANSLFIDN